MLVFVCAGGSPSLEWLFSIISRVSSGVLVRVPSGLYTESSFAFLSLQFFRIFLILADSLADSVSAQNLRHSLRLVLVWSLLYVLLLMRRLCQSVGLLLLLAAMSLRFIFRHLNVEILVFTEFSIIVPAAFKRKIYNFLTGSLLFPVICTIELEYFVLKLNELNDL